MFLFSLPDSLGRIIIFSLTVCSFVYSTPVQDEEARAKVYMNGLDALLEKLNYDQVVASWNYNTNINEQNRKTLVSFLRGIFFLTILQK